MKLHVDHVESPLGTIVLRASERGLCSLELDGGTQRARDAIAHRLARRLGTCEVEERPDPFGASSALRAYLAGRLDALDAVPLDYEGTAFQVKVWDTLRRVPPAETISYAELAARVGRPAAVRAVGNANGLNPIAVFVPCHRVVRTGGALGGYAYGLDRKRWLLDHELRAANAHRGGSLDDVTVALSDLRQDPAVAGTRERIAEREPAG